jgi:hypothetical protein
MPLKSCRKAVRVLIIVAGCASGALWADAPPTAPPPDSNALKLDQTIQGLKDQVLNFNRDATAVEQESLYPPYTRTNVFLGTRVSGLLVKEFSVTFDGAEPQKFTFDDTESLAFLLHKGFRRVVRLNLEPGSHRIRADFSGKFADAKPDAVPITGTLEAVFDKNYNDTDLELMIVRTGFMAGPSITLQQVRSAR